MTPKFTLPRWAQAALLAAIAVAASGCSTMQATKNGYLTDYSKITVDAEGGRGEFRAGPPIDPARTRLTEVRWVVQGDVGVSPADQAKLVATFKEELNRALAALPPRPDGRPAEVRAGITVVKTVSPVLNVATTLLLFIPVDEGGAAVEIEALDDETRQQLAALIQGYHAPMSEFAARFSTLAPAELALKKAAQDYAALVSNAAK
jgi:hypothetical protein